VVLELFGCLVRHFHGPPFRVIAISSSVVGAACCCLEAQSRVPALWVLQQTPWTTNYKDSWKELLKIFHDHETSIGEHICYMPGSNACSGYPWMPLLLFFDCCGAVLPGNYFPVFSWPGSSVIWPIWAKAPMTVAGPIWDRSIWAESMKLWLRPSSDSTCRSGQI